MKYEYWLARMRGISAKKKSLLRKNMKTAEAVAKKYQAFCE